MNIPKEVLLKTEDEQILQLKRIIKFAIADYEFISNKLINPPKLILTKQQTYADKMAAFLGNWLFLCFTTLFLFAWILGNTAIPYLEVFDPYILLLMNLVIGVIVLLLLLFTLMQQNMDKAKTRMHRENDYLIHLKMKCNCKN